MMKVWAIRKTRKYIGTICLFLILPLISAFPNSGANKFFDFKISFLGIENGLSNNSVTSIFQDKRGFVWIGTYEGLNRYDGYDFSVFRNQPNDTSTLVNNRIVSIYGGYNYIWVGTKKGISVYDYTSGRFSGRYSINPETGKEEKIVSAINEIKGYKGRIYIATGGEGLLYQNGEHEICRKISLNINGELFWKYHAQGLDFDSEGRMWVFIQGVGIAVLTPGKQELQVVSSVVKNGRCVVLDDDSNFWVGLDNGLLRYNTKDNSHFVFSEQMIRYNVTDLMYVKDKKQIWAATDGNGVVQYDVEQGKFSPLDEGVNRNRISSNSVFALFQDSGGRKWIGTLRGGVNVLAHENQRFRTVARNSSQQNTLPGNYILSFYEKDKEKIWVGTDGKGISLWDRRKNTFTNYSHDPENPKSLSNNFVTGIETGKKGYWFGTYGGGVSLFDVKTGDFKRYALYDERYGYDQKNVWVLFKDCDDQLWATTPESKGLFRYNPLHDVFDFLDVGISGIVSMAQDSSGSLWVGTFSQLVRIDLEGMKHDVFNIGYPVRTILPKSQEVFLVGTEGGGLLEFDPASGPEKMYTQLDGLPNNSVLNIVEDCHGMYWLSTYNGISKFNIKTSQFVNYYDSDGLQSNQFNYNAALRLSSGELLMGGIKGFNIINPDVPNSPSRFPELLITAIKINNVPLDKSGKTAFGISELELPYDQSMLTVDFVGLEYSMPDKISYAYTLEGWDSEWHYVGNTRVANYSKLTEGNYTLKIKSTNSDGTWNTEVIALPVTIFPPWYRTPWAYSLYGILGLGLVFGVFSYQKNQARLKYEICLSEERVKQEQELNKKKLAFFTNVSHEFRSPLTMIINPLKEFIYGQNQGLDPEAIEAVYRNSRRLLSLVDQLLLFRKTESETGELKVEQLEAIGLCKEVYACFVHHAKSKGIRFEFQANEEEIFIYADRQKLEMTLFNLIANALKFTERNEGRVIVRLNASPDELVVSVSDNGEGIPDQEKEKVFGLFYQSARKGNDNKKGFGIGLYLVRKFIQQQHGEVNCSNTDFGGTTFNIKLKKGKAHFKEVLIHENFDEHAFFLEDLMDEKEVDNEKFTEKEPIEAMKEIVQSTKTVFVIDDNPQIRQYIRKILSDTYKIIVAKNAEEGIEHIRRRHPDLIISDVVMGEMNGVEFCKLVKNDRDLKHIPVILLTASSSEGVKLKGVEVGADDYITKPFDKDYLRARVKSILKRQETLHDHFLNVVTHNTLDQKLSDEDKKMLDQIVEVIESNMEEGTNIKTLAEKVGMSHSLMYKRIKQLTGKSLTEFARFIRLRKVATLLISSEVQVNEAAAMGGFSDMKYFRKQFQQQYEMNPSEFQKKYKNGLQDKQFILNEKLWKNP